MSFNYKGTTADLFARIKEMRSDLYTLKYNTEDMKLRYKDVFEASHHLFNVVIANKIDMNMLELMLNKMENKIYADTPEVSHNADKEMGKILAEKFLYPTIGKQPELTKEREEYLIQKVKEENAKSDEKLQKLNSGEITPEEFKQGKSKIEVLE